MAARVRVAVAALASVWLLYACSSPAPSPSPSPVVALEEALTATVYLPRLVRDDRTVAVLLRNDSPSPVRVLEVELVTDSFAPTGPVAKDVVIAPGSAKALPLTYGEGQCDGQTSPPVAPAHAALVLEVDGQSVSIQLPLPNSDDLAPRLHADCAAQFVTAAIDVRLEGWAGNPDGTLQTTLLVSRVAGDEPVTVNDLKGSVLYRLTATNGLPVVLPSGTERVEIPVTVSPARCDGHAMADAKFPYLFLAYVTIGDSPLLPGHITTDEPGKEALPEMWNSLCGTTSAPDSA